MVVVKIIKAIVIVVKLTEVSLLGQAVDPFGGSSINLKLIMIVRYRS
jgi:hypothetical protein